MRERSGSSSHGRSASIRSTGIDLVGFVDAEPLESRAETRDVSELGGLDDLQSARATSIAIDRVIVAFSNEPDSETMDVVRSLRDRDVIVDVVPRLFDLIGPRASMHLLEGMPLVCVPPARLSRSSFVMKRAVDIVVATLGLLLIAAPLFAYAAIRIKLDSPGPVFFRQERLGLDMRPVHLPQVPDDAGRHRSRASTGHTSSPSRRQRRRERERHVQARPRRRRDAVRQLAAQDEPRRAAAADQRLRGDMSLVGPRPCIPYEIEFFQPHHVERFLVPQGITGLWQVSARANSTFGEALDMDVAYVRGWSLGLDLRLLFRTPFALLRQRRATA